LAGIDSGKAPFNDDEAQPQAEAATAPFLLIAALADRSLLRDPLDGGDTLGRQ